MTERKIKWDALKGLPDEAIEAKATEILAIMTLDEKLWQMIGDYKAERPDQAKEERLYYTPFPAGVDDALGIPGIHFTDGPRGVGLGYSTCFPVPMARGATWDLDLERRIGNAIGIEAKAQGANFYGGVCINLLRHPAWGRAQETFGEDPFHLGAFGVALLTEVQNHVMACAKHYACNSMENVRFVVDVRLDERTLREVYLWHFHKCVDAGVAAVMSAYNKVNGNYCGHNAHLLRDILKQEWRFPGFVLTDFLLGIYNGAKAVAAGVDIEMPIANHMKTKKLKKYLEKGKITLAQIDDAVLRILRRKLKFAHEGDPAFYTTAKVACQEHIQLALEAARKSIVLLKNENNILPLQRQNLKKIGVIGSLADTPNIGDNGSSSVYPPYIITPLEGIRKAAGSNLEIIYNDATDPTNAETLARQSDAVIVVVGFTSADEGEYIPPVGGDRDSLRLHPEDEALILRTAAANPNCIVILEGGSAIILEAWKDVVPAVLMAWYPGMEGGTAMGKILFGDINPCGKLPIIFPKTEAQLPFYQKHAESIEYGYYHGYKLLERNNETPAFPFGFGLSYTSYTYSNLRINKETISPDEILEIKVDITNVGTLRGEEIVQLYVSYIGSAVDRPIKELKGFGKVILDPSQTKTLNLTLSPTDLAYYDTDSNQWVIENIAYRIYVGPSSLAANFLEIAFKIS
ncbi:MAG: glycosyl hydrolase [Promethearchaeota archaeon]|nr:MAG: glycosyl hydrolase [Candidatus Lokiarchaeota archaeon]